MSKALGSKRRTVLFVANTSWYLFNFRLSLGKEVLKRGYDVVFVSPPDEYVRRIEDAGIRYVPLHTLHRSSLNPFKEFSTLLEFIQIYRTEQPLLVHHFTIKCVLYGTLSALFLRCQKVVNSITGMGHVFLSQRSVIRLFRPFIKFIYSSLLKRSSVKVIFQNPDDRAFFLSENLVRESNVFLIKSSGVNLERFSALQKKGTYGSGKCILFAGRLLKEKGIYDFIDAFRVLKSKHQNLIALIAGVPDLGNPSSVSPEEVEVWKKIPDLHFLGHVDRLETVIQESDIVVLPSYREGVPKVLLEAAAMEKPLVATDVPGCREVVKNGVNGFLVPICSPEAVSKAIQTLLESSALCHSFGLASKRIAEEEFSEVSVNQRTLEIYGLPSP